MIYNIKIFFIIKKDKNKLKPAALILLYSSITQALCLACLVVYQPPNIDNSNSNLLINDKLYLNSQ